ncbi:hypothetical protein WP1_069 [Pseudomonas phage WP1]
MLTQGPIRLCACSFISTLRANSFLIEILHAEFSVAGALEACLYLLTAHLLSLSTMQVQGVAGGGVRAGGTQGGFITSATVGEVSVARLAPPARMVGSGGFPGRLTVRNCGRF